MLKSVRVDQGVGGLLGGLRRMAVRFQHFVAQTVVCVMACGIFLAGPGAARAQGPADDAASKSEPPKVLAPAAAAIALPDTPAGRVMGKVIAALNDAAAPLGESAFSEAFLKQVPYAQLEQVMNQLRTGHGGFTPHRIDKQEGEHKLVVGVKTVGTAQNWQVLLSLNADDKIEGLLLRPSMGDDEPPLRDWNDFDQRMRDLPGTAVFAAYEVRLTKAGAETPAAPGEGAAPKVIPKLAIVHGLREDKQLAIGSTFKLYVLGALAEAVKSGTARWDEKLAIKSIYKSLPSGKMQDEAEGAGFPISQYADLMISISDNTATDHLMHRIERESIETYMAGLHGRPSLNRPFLTTRELFAIKLKPDPTLLERWLGADEAIRRDMLLPDDQFRPTRPAGPTHNPGEIAAWGLDTGKISSWKQPKAIDKVEWFASAEELCRLIADLARLEQSPGMEPLGHALRINPGLPLDSKKWPKIAFKGGSEPGVLNLTWLLANDEGKLFAVSIGWNDPEHALEESKMLGLAKRAIEHLAK